MFCERGFFQSTSRGHAHGNRVFNCLDSPLFQQPRTHLAPLQEAHGKEADKKLALATKAQLFRRIVLFVIPGYLLVVVGCLARNLCAPTTSDAKDCSGQGRYEQSFDSPGPQQRCVRIAAFVMAPSAVRWFGASTEMLPFALAYLQVRAFFMVMGRVRDSCNVVCLAEKDSVTPFVASVIAFVANVLGDLLLCPKYGAFGAAVATDVATSVAAGFTLQSLRHSGLWPKKFPCPGRRENKHFAKYAFNLFLSAVALLMILISETRLASKMGTTSGAAHQILDAIWRIAGLSLSLPMEWAGQTFLTKDLTGAEWRHIASMISTVAVCFSLLSAGCVLVFLRFRVDWFTRDPLVQADVFYSTPSVAMCSGLIVLSQTLMSYLISLGKVHFVPITGGMLVALFTASSYILYLNGGAPKLWAIRLEGVSRCALRFRFRIMDSSGDGLGGTVVAHWDPVKALGPRR
ncbi:DTX47 [Symbiodinium natans]|uniref:DTX47 protein n=1 Tax=Symbiodinium natans TaxID=878477 RepID=A0A812U6X4_9DINO|nr:DTX47 [Symbiodinium natans]